MQASSILAYDILTVRTVKVKSLKIEEILVHIFVIYSLYDANISQKDIKSKCFENKYAEKSLSPTSRLLLYIFYHLLVAWACIGLLGCITDTYAEQRLVALTETKRFDNRLAGIRIKPHQRAHHTDRAKPQ